MTNWTTTGASVKGTSHEQQGTECQDAHAYHHDDQTLILAIADGAGSATHGGTGALLATTAATSYLAGALGRRRAPRVLKRVLQQTVEHTRRAIEQTAIARGHDVKHYATTFLAAVLQRDYIGIIQMGDGAIIIQDGDGTLRVLTTQQEREYVNEVTFLTCSTYHDELRISVLRARRLRAVCLVTDGVETLSVRRATNTPHPGFFNPLLNNPVSPEQLVALLTSPGACDRSDDDKTILLATKGPQ